MKKYILGFVLLVATMSSCYKNFLETKSTQSVDQAGVFATTENALGAINGLHRLMYYPGSAQNYCGQESMMIMMDMMGEDVVYPFSNTYYLTSYKWQLHRTENSAMLNYVYSFYYKIISNANMIIHNIDDAEGPETERNYIKGQAYAYRAWAHFTLVQMFAQRYVPKEANAQLGVPLMLENTRDGLARSTVAQVYEQINIDLDDAIALLSKTHERTTKMHINVKVAKGLKARVALTQGEWGVAAEMAKEARVGTTLNAASYTEIPRFGDQKNTEWIWGTLRTQDQDAGFNSFQAFVANVNSAVNRAVPRCIYDVLYKQISATDVRKGVWAGTPAQQNSFLIAENGKRALYMANKFLVTNQSSTVGDVPYMRAPEMLLVEAEARARNNEDGPAQNLLFELMSNRDPKAVKSTKTGQALVEEIWLQRRIELWLEGFRFFDLKRNDLPLKRESKSNHKATYCVVYDISANDKLWQFLFPLEEKQLNPNLVQNEY